MKMRLIIVAVFMTALQFGSFAQEKKKSSLNWNVDISNRHLFRGGLTVNTPTIKPTLEYSKGGFTAGAWGAYATDGSYQEIDLYLGYSIGRFNVTVYDYYCPSSDNAKGNFFDYNNTSGVHTWDVVAQYKISGDIPLTILASCYFAGNCDAEGKERYSTYFELNYLSKIAGKDVIWTAGMAPGNTSYSVDKDGIERDDFSIVNLGLKVKDRVKLTDNFKLPVYAGLTLNPLKERLYFTIGINIGN